jgi:hypothetical protein
LILGTSIIIAIAAAIVIARTRMIKVTPSPVVIGGPSAINIHGIVSIIVTCRAPVNPDAHSRSRRDNGINAPRHKKEISNQHPGDQSRKQSRFEELEGVHRTKNNACQALFVNLVYACRLVGKRPELLAL